MQKRITGLLALILMLCTSAIAFAQSVTVTGAVIDSGNEPLIGVNVQVRGTTIGTVTNIDGTYSLQVPGNQSVLVFSYVGYLSQEMVVGNQRVINITLLEDLQNLEEVVVIGYGVQKKVNLTGAVDAVRGDRLAERPVSSTSLALQGMSPGTTVINRGGEPGAAGGQIRIRGIGTINNANPLILIDGVRVDNIDNIDPQDIESISILKDAASSAIYGARAANGVILVTTKRGKTEGMQVTYNGYIGWQSLTRAPVWVGADDYMRLVNESMINAGRLIKYTDEEIRLTMAGTDPYNYPNTDWWGLLFRVAPQQRHTISVNGGGERVKTAVSFNYLEQEGVMINSFSNQYGIRLNNDIKLSKYFDLGVDLNLSVRNRETPARIGDIYWNLLHDVPPTIAARDPEGGYPLGTTNRNPLAAAEISGYERRGNIGGIASTYLNFHVFDGLTLTGRFSIKEDIEERKRFRNGHEFKDYHTKNTVLTWISDLYEYSTQNHYTDLQLLANYNKSFGLHDVNALIGYSQEYNKYRYLEGSRRDFYSNALQALSVGSDEGKNSTGYDYEWAMRSVFGRVNYAFSEKYLIEANFRYDGSSRFAKGNRFGFFPSFSGAWRISEEAFLKNTEMFDNLKLRASWGKLGNQELVGGNQVIDGLYQYIHTMATGRNYAFNNALVSGVAQTALANELISWESTTTTDVGIDVGIFSNKLSLTGDFFIRTTDNMLLRQPIPSTIGLSAPIQNVGTVKNTGWEIAINYRDKIGEFDVGIMANLSDVHNKIVKYGDQTVRDWFINKEGESIDALFGYVAEGLFQTQEQVDNHAFQHSMTAPGDIIYKDTNGDGIINGDDKVVIGSTIPRYTYGFNLFLGYKGFDFTAFFNGVGKCNGYQYGALIEGPIWDGFTTKEMLDRWTPENPNATWPRLVYNTIHNQEASSYWIQDTRHFRLKNAQIGYTFPKSVINTLNISRLRLYVSGENIFTLTKAKNLDPEYPSGRVNYYPQTKIYTIGLNVSF